MKKGIFFIVILLVASVSFYLCLGISITQKKNSSVQWEERFKRVLYDIRKCSIRNYDWGEVEWDSYYKNQLRRLPINNQDTFYECITQALIDLKDNHSFLLRKTDYCQSAENFSPKVFIKVDNGIGIIKIPALGTRNVDQIAEMLQEEWVMAFHKKLRSVTAKVYVGWIVDLTENNGGNMYPMLAALSIFYKNSTLGGFQFYDATGKKHKQLLQFDGQVFSFNGEASCLKYKRKLPINKNKLPLVVLIGPMTASSAEFVALALKRQKNTIFIGQRTRGLATCNCDMDLPDHYGIYMLTTGHFLDINNEPLLQGYIEPSLLVLDSKAHMLVKAKETLRQTSQKI